MNARLLILRTRMKRAEFMTELIDGLIAQGIKDAHETVLRTNGELLVTHDNRKYKRFGHEIFIHVWIVDTTWPELARVFDQLWNKTGPPGHVLIFNFLSIEEMDRRIQIQNFVEAQRASHPGLQVFDSLSSSLGHLAKALEEPK